ncbi:TPA: hypothetical protein RFU16_000346 [Klebsiella quasipneumoniae subsp. similipneumoniae]|uniref:hypothetical protein n=1 Tax=Klebsiella quasipneumoniae TaxID=1463165 RepID=UPI0027F0B3BA|nr:hypothetical protein [Klebsiella quasipneumoniae subsp. similipneumoniae]HDU5815905.1 hypothetical protein [Klebsiella quasipneumoniae subsp. similipneumoniae]
MAYAHCVCPGFVSSHISDPVIFSNIFMGVLLNSDDQIVIDSKGRLPLEYAKSVEKNTDAFALLKVWQTQLDKRKDGKVLLTNCEPDGDIHELVFKLIQKAATTFDRDIVTSNNEAYRPYIDELKRQRISIYNLQNLSPGNIKNLLKKKLSFDELSNDVAWALHRLARTSNKGLSEDDINDQLRNMLLCMKYQVKDQTREGRSSSGKGAGELDLIIEDDGELFSIVEAMKLNSVKVEYINEHYKKLLTNYNPLQITKTILITYYTGSRFDDWWEGYTKHISSMDVNLFNFDGDAEITSTEVENTLYPSLKKLIQHFEINGRHHACVHYALKF